MYLREFDNFYKNLYDGRFEEMWNYLKAIHNETEKAIMFKKL